MINGWKANLGTYTEGNCAGRQDILILLSRIGVVMKPPCLGIGKENGGVASWPFVTPPPRGIAAAWGRSDHAPKLYFVQRSPPLF